MRNVKRDTERRGGRMTTAELREILDDENRKLTADANIIKLPRTEMFSVFFCERVLTNDK